MKILLVGNRSIQHLLSKKLELEGCKVDVYPGQKFGVYTCVASEQVLESDYDLIVMGSARYFDDPVIAELRGRGTPYFGPDSSAGQLETSKERFKVFADKYAIPTPDSITFTSYEAAMAHIDKLDPPYVIKADGPARGCGVTICHDKEEARQDLKKKLSDKTSLYYCGRVTIERFISGFEVAINVFIDGKDYVLFPPTKPHKRRNDGDSGPIVAGMGSIAPIRLSEVFYKEFEQKIIRPTIQGIAHEGWEFRGCLFVNLMVTDNEISVLEFNCRMGDPAMLVDLMLLEDGLSSLLSATVRGDLSSSKLAIRDGAAAAVTLIDKNYPENPTESYEFEVSEGLLFDDASNRGLVIAGAERTGTGRARVNSGVVATAVAFGESYEDALDQATRLAQYMPRFHSRTDIGADLLLPAKYRMPGGK